MTDTRLTCAMFEDEIEVIARHDLSIRLHVFDVL
jgi:hypothetical protein